MRTILVLSLGLYQTIAASPLTAAASPEDVQMQWGIRIPMRDGVHLNATLYLPKDHVSPTPAIFTLTPYIGQTYHEHGVYFAAHGYPFLTVDVRGRGNSEGVFKPLINEAKDGHDVVEWLARQPYCNEQVAMWGGSYAGYDQWATAKEFPAHLVTIVPVASPYAGVDFPMRNNIASPYVMQWLTLVAGRTLQDKLFWNNEGFWGGKFRMWFESGAPFKALDSKIGNPSAIFQEWLAHPKQDAYWDRYNPTPKQYSKLSLPILTITGSYDGDQPGALMHYREHVKNASASDSARHYLVIGPWDHAGTRIPKAEFAGLKVGPASLVDLAKLHLEWYAWTMQGGPRPEFLKRNVAYYVMGAEKWRYADTLEEITARSAPLYLQSSANPTDVFRSGSLSDAPSVKSAPDYYLYDPRDVSLATLESTVDPFSAADQRMIYAGVGRRLVYHSAPFEADTEISGFFKLSAWLAIDQPDTDFRVSIYEIDLHGSAIELTTDSMRARYRESLREEKLIRTSEPLRYDFERFRFVSRQIAKGHRLRLVIGPINSIYAQKNYNSGGVVSEESMQDAHPVTVKLFHDEAHPSALHVPFGHRDTSVDEVSHTNNQARFESLAQRAVDHQLGYAPIRAYFTGLLAPDHRRWPDRSLPAIRAFERGNDALLAELRSIDPVTLSRESVSYDILKEQLESELQYRVCHSELWQVSHMNGWHLTMVRVAQEQPVGTADERAQALERWAATPQMIDQEIDNLRHGLIDGYSSPKSVVRRVIKQIAALVEAPADKSPLLSPAERSEDAQFKASFTATIADHVNPALRRYQDFLQKDYLPKARDALGVAAHSDGAQCYQAALRWYTTLNRSAQDVYDLGRRTVEQNAAIVADLGSRKFGTRDLSTVLSRIKEAPDNRFNSKEALVAFSREVVTRAREKSAALFAKMPNQTVLVEPFREFMLGSGASSHYELQVDESKPAYYRIATDDWSRETRGGAELTAAHETYPGHHMQMSFARTLEQSPLAKLSENSAYIEGWARYAEMLAEEAGIYETDYARMSRRIWPARGMVADPGLHVLGWSREQTIQYLGETGRFTDQQSEDLVDRMAILPGQLTSYDSGGLEFMALREQAKAELGVRFDIREFHRIVLGEGVVPLNTLRRNVEGWIEQSKAGKTP